MSELVTCATCGQRLRVPDELLGQKVKCPGCATTFTAETSPVTAPAPPAPPSPPEEPVPPPPPNLSLDDEPAEAPGPPQLGTPESVSPTPPSPAPAAPPAPVASTGGEDELEPCPFCGERIRKGLLRCPYCEEPLSRKDDGEPPDEEEGGETRPWERRGRRRVRRDCEPHRGSLILTLGIVSIPLALIAASCSCCSYGIGGIAGVIGLALAIPAWVMGHRDLAKMQAGTMDPEGQGSTQGGMICGIIGTALNALGLLLAIIMVIFLIVILATSGGPGGGPFAPVPPPPPPPPPRRVKELKKAAAVVPRFADYLPRRLAPKG
jgi:hypothetical protein